MKIKRLILIATLPLLALSAMAQKSVSPDRGEWTFAVTLSYNNFASIEALPAYQTTYEASALDINWSQKSIMVGAEAGVFVHPQWKISFGGGFNLSRKPGYPGVDGTVTPGATPEEQMGEIPDYRAVGNQQSFNYQAFLGVDRYFFTSVANLMWYVGARGSISHGYNEIKYDEYTSMGKSSADTFNGRVALVGGVEYYLTPRFFFGGQIDACSWIYNRTAYQPQEGLKSLMADAFDWAFLSAPTLKVGFKF